MAATAASSSARSPCVVPARVRCGAWQTRPWLLTLGPLYLSLSLSLSICHAAGAQKELVKWGALECNSRLDECCPAQCSHRGHVTAVHTWARDVVTKSRTACTASGSAVESASTISPPWGGPRALYIVLPTLRMVPVGSPATGRERQEGGEVTRRRGAQTDLP